MGGGMYEIITEYKRQWACKWLETDQEASNISLQINANHIDGSVQDYRISSGLAKEILQSCTKPPIYTWSSYGRW